MVCLPQVTSVSQSTMLSSSRRARAAVEIMTVHADNVPLSMYPSSDHEVPTCTTCVHSSYEICTSSSLSPSLCNSLKAGIITHLLHSMLIANTRVSESDL